MWRLKQLMPKEQAGLEGKTVEVESMKVQVRATIAQGGFSCVYQVRDAASGKQYALKHMICNDQEGESLGIVRKEVEVMRSLRGHPNVVTLHAYAVHDSGGRTKECFLIMDLCEKALVHALDGVAFMEEKQILSMFRDVCNAVYAMHCQSPPIAHRDLKAENVLLGGDGQWKLCDFGSTSTNHKRFERADEMGIEEDNIRKHTTPAYRAPEMWDLYRRERISEKVDIWALGCLLYRMTYLKSAFDGESKLQILNGNYRIPDTPSYSTVITGLIKDMLQSDPDARPDVMQIWQRVNASLPPNLRKSSPDKLPSHQAKGLDSHGSRATKQPPSRAPPQPSPQDVDRRAKEANQRLSQTKDSDQKGSNSSSGVSSPVGSFWSTQHGQESSLSLDRSGLTVSPPQRNKSPELTSELKKSGALRNPPRKAVDPFHHAGGRTPHTGLDGHDEFGQAGEDTTKAERVPKGGSTGAFQKLGAGDTKVHSTNELFNDFVADFQGSVNVTLDERSVGKESSQLELEKIKEELKIALIEKAEAVSKYEKLTAICRSQRQEIQELKSRLAASSSPSGVAFNNNPVSQNPLPKPPQQRPQSSSIDQQVSHQQAGGKQTGTIWDVDGFSSSVSVNKQSPDRQSLGKQSGPIWDGEGFSSSTSSVKKQSPERQSMPMFSKSSIPIVPPNESYDGPIFDTPKDSQTASFASADNWAFVSDNHTPMGINFPSSTSGRDSYNLKGEKIAPKSTSKSSPAGWAGF